MKAITIMMTLISSVSVAGGQNPTSSPAGASAFFTSNDPTVARQRELILAGQLKQASEIARETIQKAGPADRRIPTEVLTTIDRIRYDYNLSRDGLVARLRSSIPDITAADLERWRQAGLVQWRMLDGQVCYFRREPGNIFRFCEEAKRRRDAQAGPNRKPDTQADSDAKLNDHLAKVIAAAEQTKQAEVLPIRHRIRYQLTVLPDRPGAKVGSVVRCWLPFPQVYRQQREVKLISTSPAEHTLAPNAVDGDPVTGAPQRTVYFERRLEDPAKPMTFEEVFEFIVSAYYPDLDGALARPAPEGALRGYLAERPPHIVFTPELRAVVDNVVAGESNPLAKVRKIYHFIAETVRYCAEEEYAIIPSFSIKALTSKRGDCGVQSMLLITLCRISGIPARWQSGFETQPWDWNMHDWAEFYVDPWGWLPMDMSYGLRQSDDSRVREFYIGHLDSYRMIVNLDYGSPLQPPKQSLRSEPADFQRGEVEIDGRNLYFDEWKWDIHFHWPPT